LATLISAALIVRDEARFLRGCLASISNLVDEIVVVDTGSIDDSAAIATGHGARVYHHVWQDDFSAARNQALDYATGDWILYIDADERVRPYERTMLAQELADPKLCTLTVRFHPRTGFTAYPEHRLFRRDPRIRFRGAMHETMLPDLLCLIETGQGARGASNLTIDHLGSDGDQTPKLERNLRLLAKELQVSPDRIYLWWHLGTVYRDLGRTADALAAWMHGIEIARHQGRNGPYDTLCFVETIKHGLEIARPMTDLIREAIDLQPDNLFLHWLRARALAADGQFAEAITIFQRLGAIDERTLLADIAYDQRTLGAAALAEAGHCAYRMGAYRDGEAWYRRAEQCDPDNLEYRVKRQFMAARAEAMSSR
jgi:glycosyltransferase involved in cell wall biosynthesis